MNKNWRPIMIFDEIQNLLDFGAMMLQRDLEKMEFVIEGPYGEGLFVSMDGVEIFTSPKWAFNRSFGL
jgi:hypothetical protein